MRTCIFGLEYHCSFESLACEIEICNYFTFARFSLSSFKCGYSFLQDKMFLPLLFWFTDNFRNFI